MLSHMGKLLLLFIGLPAVELALLIELGARIGTTATIGLIVVTGIVGANLARQQGLRVVGQIQETLARGELPTGQLVDGLLIVVAAALLVTPGVLTDAFGFMCLTPWFRERIKATLLQRFERAVAEQRIHVAVHAPDLRAHPADRGEMIDVTPPPDGADRVHRRQE